MRMTDADNRRGNGNLPELPVSRQGLLRDAPVGPALSRRHACSLALGLIALSALPARARAAGSRFGPDEAFSRQRLVEVARRLAATRYVAPAPSASAAANFDAYVQAAYGPAEVLPGNLRLFPASQAVAPAAVALHIVENGRARRLRDASGLYPGTVAAEPAGFRVMNADLKADWLAFMGASYFRAAGSTGQYGISARGIAIDTGAPAGEEFPAFTAFWIEPVAADRIKVHALLDGPSLTGAFTFDSHHHLDGDRRGVSQDVQASLFFRRDIARLGIAPASSMFWYDQTGPRADWRPEIHDSDGLAIWSGTGERVWRPLDNPRAARLSAFRADSPRAFGLIQRDQTFANYQDDGAFYDRRPGLWVEPKGSWGPGAVMLYEMPTAGETLDNIAAFWVPDAPARKGGRRELAYTLTWTSADPSADAASRCVDLYEGPAGIPGAAPESGARKFVFDFSGPALSGLARDSGVTAGTDLPAEAVIRSAAYPVVGEDGHWRVMLDVRTAKLPRPEFRVYLKRGADALSETVIKAIDR